MRSGTFILIYSQNNFILSASFSIYPLIVALSPLKQCGHVLNCLKQQIMRQACTNSLLIIACALVFATCKNPSPPPGATKTEPHIDSTEAAKTVAAEQQAFMEAFRKGDSIGVANVYTTDAKVMNAGMPAAEGIDSITHFFGRIFKNGPLMITTTTLGVWNNTGMIVEEGKWIMADKNGEAYDHGKYLILWKMEDGKWKKFRDCHNSDIYPK
jgi:ketosteroid isomerase-like protein